MCRKEKGLRLFRTTALLSFIFGGTMASAQPPTLEWSQSYAGWQWPVPAEVIQTSDGGYAVGGVYSQWGPFVQKVDSDGVQEWRNVTCLPGTLSHAVSCLVQNPDSSYFVAGARFAQPWEGQFWAASRLSPAGDTTWAGLLNTTGMTGPSSVRRCSDGGYIIGGATNLLRLNASGQELFNRSWNEETCDAFPVSDGYVAGGNVPWFNHYYFARTDIFGIITDSTIYTTPAAGVCYTMEQALDGGYVMGGTDSLGFWENDKDLFLMKVDLAGNVLWTRTFNTAYDERIMEIRRTSDGGYVMLVDTLGEFKQLWKVNALGDSLWSIDVSAYTMSVTRDGGFVFANFDYMSPGLLHISKYTPAGPAVPAPTRVTLVVDATSVHLRWDSVPGATAYRVHSSMSSDGVYELDLTGTFSGTTWLAPVPGNMHFYYVTAIR